MPAWPLLVAELSFVVLVQSEEIAVLETLFQVILTLLTVVMKAFRA